jgi:hypothetical protein
MWPKRGSEEVSLMPPSGSAVLLSRSASKAFLGSPLISADSENLKPAVSSRGRLIKQKARPEELIYYPVKQRVTPIRRVMAKSDTLLSEDISPLKKARSTPITQKTSDKKKS